MVESGYQAKKKIKNILLQRTRHHKTNEEQQQASRLKSTQAFVSEVTWWRSEVLVMQSQGGGILTVYGLILGHVLWEDFAQLRD